MLRLLKSSRANTLVAAAPLVGVTQRSLQRWWKQYRQQGLESLLEVAPTRQSRLSQEQQQALMEEAGKGDFSTIHEIVDWVEKRFGIHYTQVGMWKLVKRLKIKKKTARPRHVLKDEKAAEGQLQAWLMPDMQKNTFQVFLDDFSAELKVDTLLLVDGAPAHRARLKLQDKLKLQLLPAYSPELNPVERLFQEMRKALSNQVFTNLQQVESLLTQALKPYF